MAAILLRRPIFCRAEWWYPGDVAENLDRNLRGDPSVRHIQSGGARNACGWLLAMTVALTGCSTVVDGSPRAASRGPAGSGPIYPAQLVELLTPSRTLAVQEGNFLYEQDMESALFVGAEPAQCHGVAAFGRFPLLPKNYTGRDARTQSDALKDQHQLLEVAASYPSNFNAAGFLESVRKTVSDCQRPIAAWGDSERRVTVNPTPLTSSPPEVVQWSTNLAGQQWVCDFAVIAKANVIAQIVTCSPDHSVDIKTLVTKRLQKIDQLINSRV
jgi:hypothetical protein